jgi:hypothetical protein
MNNYRSAFEPIRRSHDDVPVLSTGGRRTLAVGIGRSYPKALPDGEAIRSYESSTHLIDSEGQPNYPVREQSSTSRRRLMVAALASITLAASAYAVDKGLDHEQGPDVAPLVHQIDSNENNHDPIQDPTQVTPAEESQAAATSNNP